MNELNICFFIQFQISNITDSVNRFLKTAAKGGTPINLRGQNIMFDLPTKTTWIEWKRKRRNTLIGFIIIGTVVGIDCSVVFNTLYLYLRDVVKTDKPQMWYGLIVAFFYMSSSIFGAFSGRWLDRTRRVRAYVNMSLLVQIIGFLIYAIPFHPVILLVGRIICGISEPFSSVVSGEIFRIYDKEGSTRAMVWLASIYSFGFIIGPMLNFVFTGIEFKIGAIQINNLNVVGVMMPVVLLLIIIIANFLVHDCSLEFDLKEYLQNTSTNMSSVVETSFDAGGTITPGTNSVTPLASVNNGLLLDTVEINRVTKRNILLRQSDENSFPIKVVLRNLLTNKDTLLIFVATFVFMYTIFAITALIPLLVTITLNWKLQSLSIAYVGLGLSYFVVLLFIARYCKSNRCIYFISIASIVSQIITCCSLICLNVLERNFKRDVFIIVLFILSLVLGWCFDDVLIRVLLGNMVPSKIQSFSETLRAGICKIAITAACFTVTDLLPWVHWWSTGILFFYILLLVIFLVRREHMINPKEIPFIVYTPKPSKPSIQLTYDNPYSTLP